MLAMPACYDRHSDGGIVTRVGPLLTINGLVLMVWYWINSIFRKSLLEKNRLMSSTFRGGCRTSFWLGDVVNICVAAAFGAGDPSSNPVVDH